MIRNATSKDLETILKIYETARLFMRKNGNASQWINGYPSKELLLSDIQKNELFVIEENQKIHAVFAFIIGKDKTYEKIYEGQWLNNEKYGTIHRIASDGSKKGVLNECISWAKKQIKNLRGDTHADNIPMQNALKKEGFKYCGIIYIEDGTPRLAYQSL